VNPIESHPFCTRTFHGSVAAGSAVALVHLDPIKLFAAIKATNRNAGGTRDLSELLPVPLIGGEGPLFYAAVLPSKVASLFFRHILMPPMTCHLCASFPSSNNSIMDSLIDDENRHFKFEVADCASGDSRKSLVITSTLNSTSNDTAIARHLRRTLSTHSDIGEHDFELLFLMCNLCRPLRSMMGRCP
jgi:hypothetical protein